MALQQFMCMCVYVCVCMCMYVYVCMYEGFLAPGWGFCFHLLSSIMGWFLLLSWILSTLEINHITFDGGDAVWQLCTPTSPFQSPVVFRIRLSCPLSLMLADITIQSV